IANRSPDDRAHWVDGIVIAVRGATVHVENDGGESFLCSVRRVLRSRMIAERSVIAVGDRVRFVPVELRTAESSSPEGSIDRQGVVEDILPRHTTLIREYGDRVHVIAANVDQALIVASVDEPPLRPHLIDRFLVAVHKGGLRPVICINKCDFPLDADAAEFLDDVTDRYLALQYQVVRTSVVAGDGIDAIRDLLKDKISVLVGMSGVGKSSLLNAVQPGLRLRVGDVSDSSRRGQHTTTTALLLRLETGGYVVDTPGVRQFELAHVDAEELEAYFPEFVDRVAHCRYPNCRHLDESDCAIRAAVDAGEIHPDRYDSFVRMLTQRLQEPRR
ncbi:MAG: ribosome small subunit-dependent GTPase A, partial [Phycisphaerae bacterium]